MFLQPQICTFPHDPVSLGIHAIPVEQIKEIVSSMSTGMPWWGSALTGFVGAMIGAVTAYFTAKHQSKIQLERDKKTAEAQEKREKDALTNAKKDEKMKSSLDICIKYYKQISMINFKFNQIIMLKNVISALGEDIKSIEREGCANTKNYNDRISDIALRISEIKNKSSMLLSECEVEILNQSIIITEIRFRCPIKISNEAQDIFNYMYSLFANDKYKHDDIDVLNKKLAVLSLDMKQYFSEYLENDDYFGEAWSILSSTPIVQPFRNA